MEGFMNHSIGLNIIRSKLTGTIDDDKNRIYFKTFLCDSKYLSIILVKEMK